MNKESLWAIWVNRTKLSRLSFWRVRKPPDSSDSWRVLLKIRSVVKKFFSYKLGSQKAFSFWFDPWVNGQALVDLFSGIEIEVSDVAKRAKVNKVWSEGVWRLPDPLTDKLLRAWEMIESVDCLETGDKNTWHGSKSGLYSIHETLAALQGVGTKVTWHKLIWGKGCVPKYSFIAWLAVLNKLKVKARIFRWGICSDKVCPLCMRSDETVDHLFFACPFSKAIWNEIMGKCNISRAPYTWRREVSWFAKKSGGKTVLAKLRRVSFLACIYYIWLERNRLMFQQSPCRVEYVTKQVKETILFTVLQSNSSIARRWKMIWSS